MQEYDESLKPLDVSFAKMMLWVRIFNLPFGWMNEKKGSRGLVGEVVKVEADAKGKASGLFLRARVAVDIEKPLHGGFSSKQSGTLGQNGLTRSTKSYHSTATHAVGWATCISAALLQLPEML